MGSSHSNERIIPGDLSEVELSNYVEEYSTLGLSERDIIQLYVEFRKIDEDNVGSVTLDDLFAFFGIEQNVFTSIIFCSFDVDLYHLDDIDFPRFLQALWNYCTLAENRICYCIFSMFDKEQDTYLNKKLVSKLVEYLYGSDFHNCEEAKLLQKKIMDLRRKHFDAEYFEQLASEYPPLLYPAFVLQQLLRQKIMGVKFWKHLTTFRDTITPESKNGRYIPVRVLLMQRTDKNAIKRYLDNREEITAMKFATLRSKSGIKLNRDTSRLSNSNSISDFFSDNASDKSSVMGDNKGRRGSTSTVGEGCRGSTATSGEGGSSGKAQLPKIAVLVDQLLQKDVDADIEVDTNAMNMGLDSLSPIKEKPMWRPDSNDSRSMDKYECPPRPGDYSESDVASGRAIIPTIAVYESEIAADDKPIGNSGAEIRQKPSASTSASTSIVLKFMERGSRWFSPMGTKTGCKSGVEVKRANSLQIAVTPKIEE